MATAVMLLLTMVALTGSALAEGEDKSSAELVWKGDEAFRMGKYSAAVELYRSALEQDEGDSTARLKLIELLARLAGREDEARKEMKIALGMKSLTADEIELIAEICRANGFPKQARTAFERLLEMKPDDLSALGKLIEVLLSQKGFQAAEEKIEAYRDSSLSTIEGLEIIAAKCIERSECGLAAIAYEGILKKDEKNLPALLGMGNCLTGQGKFSEAAEKLSQAAECHPEKVEPAIALGQLFLRAGDYASAEKAFQNALTIDPKSAEAVEGFVAVLHSTGRYSEARQMVSEALEAHANSPRLLADMGRLLNYVGEYESAREYFQRALVAQAGYPDAILGLGLSYRETGNLGLAKEHFLRLYDFWDAHVERLHAVRPADMVDVAIACALTDNPQDAVDVLEKVLKKDPANTEALLWEARLFAERHQPKDATRELKKLLTINPNHPEAHAELASIYIQSSRYDKAAECCQRALETNPNLIRALDLLCSIQILDFDYKKAEETAKKALMVNPRSLSSLASLASCYWQMGDRAAYENVRKKVFEINPVCAEFYLTVAHACENKRRNREAIELLEQAVALKPDFAPAHTNIGILLMREGEEEEAEGYLRRSYQLDSYNPRTTNFINLLEHMKKNFVSTRTEHFLLKWHREKGVVLGFFLPEYVEQVYQEVCEEFRYEPKNPTLVEIFESHDQFSARIVGLPFIATVGASLGKVVAADSPEKGSFDWKDVLRHEFVHVVTLQQSRMQIPFWFTEGLATGHEQSPLPARWDELIAGMLYAGRIIPLKELNSYFTRPKTPTHKQAAYAESNLICRYLYEEHGQQVIRKMIEAYGENLTTGDVVPRFLSMSESEFEKKITEYIFARAREKRVAPLFLKGDGELIAKALEEKPEDSLLRVAYARWLLQEARATAASTREAKLDEAVEVLGKVIPRESRDQRAWGAYSALAEVYLTRGKWEDAKEAALQAIAVDEEDLVAHRCLGLLYTKEGNKTEAITELEKALSLYPRAPDVWYALAQLCSEERDEEGMLRALEGAAAVDRKNMNTAKKLAGIYLSRKDYARAVEVLERALRYNLYDAGIYKLMAEALEGEGDEKTARKYAEIGAEAAYITATSLMPFQREKVIELLNLALELNPEHQKAKELLSQAEGPGKPGSKERAPAGGGSEGKKNSLFRNSLHSTELSDILAGRQCRQPGCSARLCLRS